VLATSLMVAGLVSVGVACSAPSSSDEGSSAAHEALMRTRHARLQFGHHWPGSSANDGSGQQSDDAGVATPAPTQTSQPAPTTTTTPTAAPTQTAPAPTQTAPAPTQTAPAPTQTAPAPTSTSTAPAPTSTSTAPAANLLNEEVTFYGWPDNSPPGAGIADPIIHSKAGGTGTYADPITFATDATEFAPGTILYVPFIQKYVIMEDTCAQCEIDWKSGKRHIDIWMNSNSSNGVLQCEDNWTRTSAQVEVNPPSNRAVTTAPLYDTSTGVCRTTP
jgi:hypothetical protein